LTLYRATQSLSRMLLAMCMYNDNSDLIENMVNSNLS